MKNIFNLKYIISTIILANKSSIRDDKIFIKKLFLFEYSLKIKSTIHAQSAELN